MGIPSYFSYIVKNYRKILVSYKTNIITIDNLYMDCNSIIYDIVYELENDDNVTSIDIESKIITMVCNKIKHYIKIIKPVNNVFIAFDGVAPYAKMNQQKSRRYKTGYENIILRRMGVKKNKKFDTVSITPGTNFMYKLSNIIKEQFNNSIEFNINKMIVSTSYESGEGEHKIYNYIRNNKEEHKKKTTVIYGLDADLIMLTLNHLHIAESMYLFRETPYFIKSIDNTLNPNDNYLLKIPEFAKVLSLQLNDTNKNNYNDTRSGNHGDKYNRVIDYIFLSFLLGNDFLPHFPALNIRTTGIERIMDVYKKLLSGTNNNLIKKGKIQWKYFRKIMLELANNENDMIIQEYKIRNKQSKSIVNRKLDVEQHLQSIPLFDRAVEMYINPYENGWRERYYQKLFNIDIDNDKCKQICINYLEGLEWTFEYYKGDCKDWEWSYKYNYPPLISDLVKYIPSFETYFLNNNPNKPVDPLVQLSYVLPKKSLYLIPNELSKQLDSKFMEYYKESYYIEWSFCRYLWEAHIDLPNIEIKEIEEIVNNYCKKIKT